MGQKNGNPFLIALGKDKPEGAGGHEDPAGAQGDDSQHNQGFVSQEIVVWSQLEKAARRKGGKERGRKHGVSLAPNSYMFNLNLMGERGMHTKYLQN